MTMCREVLTALTRYKSYKCSTTVSDQQLWKGDQSGISGPAASSLHQQGVAMKSPHNSVVGSAPLSSPSAVKPLCDISSLCNVSITANPTPES